MASLISQMWMLLLVAFASGVAAGVWIQAARAQRAAGEFSSTGIGQGSPGRAAAPAILLDAPNGQQDDLTQIIGLDRATELKLNVLGVFHFRQVAGWDDGAARWIEIRLNEPGRVARERWTEQAATLC